MATDGLPPWCETVLHLWFRELEPTAWFTKSRATDRLIVERCLSIHEKVAQELPPEARREPQVALAAVIALDQFPRNMFRGTPRAFATDPLALALAKDAVAAGLDRGMVKNERLFLYLPFEHSENLADQHRSVELFATLGDDELLRHAVAHKAIIERFGRFPHRNSILGRPSTPEEEEFLRQPGSSF
ncbi:MAG TPA: DUF924 family protein [Hyphomicrobiaceae bacterium]|nr:DUF924 family protein [Hyphomicrobiaceae bacterium]